MKALFPRVLVCLDGSPASQAALDAALVLGKGGRLRGLFVMDRKAIRSHRMEDYVGAMGVAPFVDAEGKTKAALELLGRALLASFEKTCKQAGAACDSVLVEDNVADGILAAAKSSDLVVMGRKGAHGSGQATPVGSNVERVLRHSPAPVLVTLGGVKARFRRIAACYDDSDHARETLDLAAELTAGIKGALTVIHASEDAKAGKAGLAWARKDLAERGQKAAFVLLKGTGAEILPAVARARKYDLLVLGAYGQGYLREFLLGSTTDLVLRETRTPLLIHR